MNEFGMTPQGFKPKRMAHVLQSLNEKIADIADPASGEFPFQNVSDDSLLQQILGVFAEGLAECWEAAYDGAVQFDPRCNSGAGQQGTVQLNAMLAKPGTKTRLAVALEGKAGTTVPAGSLIADAGGTAIFALEEAAVLEATAEGSGRATACAIANECGPITPAPQNVTRILTPVSGWLAVHNEQTLNIGSYPESEEALRLRQQRSTRLTGYRQIESIYAAVLNVPGVTYCRAYQNDKTYPADLRGIPFKEVAVVAEGGDARAIAEALFLRFPVGVIGYGNTSEVFYDKQGISHTISFSRPAEIPVAVEMNVVITNRAEFPDTGAESIRQAIVAYAQYGGEGNEEGFPPGASVPCSRLYTPANSVPGHKITRLVIAALPSGKNSRNGEPENNMTGNAAPLFSTDDISIAWNQVARFDAANIRITVTAS